MINSKQYFVLKCVNDHPNEFLNNYWNVLNGSEETFKIIDSLIRLGYIVDLPADPPHLKVAITIDGFTALEEYSQHQRAENREEEANNIAKEANNISYTANKIATHANEISKSSQHSARISNLIAGVAIILSIASLIVQYLDWRSDNTEKSQQGYSESQQSEYQGNN